MGDWVDWILAAGCTEGWDFVGSFGRVADFGVEGIGCTGLDFADFGSGHGIDSGLETEVGIGSDIDSVGVGNSAGEVAHTLDSGSDLGAVDSSLASWIGGPDWRGHG